MSHARWTDFLAKTLLATTVGAVGVFVAVRAAQARDGVAGASTRSFLTVSGSLTGFAGATATMTFAFHKASATAADCVSRVDDVAVDPATHAFRAEVAVAHCPPDYFDGADVRVDVSVGETTVVTGATVNPVPYAMYADRAGDAVRAREASGPLQTRLAVLSEHGDLSPAADGWHQVGPEQYIYAQRLTGAGVPRCVAGNTDVDIQVPPSLGTSRDNLWSGRLAVFAHIPGDAAYAPSVRDDVLFSGLSYSGTAPAVRSALGSATSISLLHRDDFSRSLFVRIPCTADFTSVVLHAESFIRRPD